MPQPIFVVLEMYVKYIKIYVNWPENDHKFFLCEMNFPENRFEFFPKYSG